MGTRNSIGLCICARRARNLGARSHGFASRRPGRTRRDDLMKEQGSVRNLEQIQESDGEGRVPRGVTILLVALGAGCIVFAGLALGGKRGGPAPQKVDPLGELVTNQ